MGAVTKPKGSFNASIKLHNVSDSIPHDVILGFDLIRFRYSSDENEYNIGLIQNFDEC